MQNMTKKKGIIYISLILITCLMLSVLPQRTYAADKFYSPFKKLTVGSKKVTNLVKKLNFAKGSYDGVHEIYLSDISGSIKKGSKIICKLKKGFKLKSGKMHYTDANGNSHTKKLKKKTTIPCDPAYFTGIEMTIKKGKYVTAIWITNEEFDEEEDEDYYDY